MDLVLFGIQGSGKGTQSRIIAEKGGFEIFETGAELRKLSDENTPLAQKVKSIVEAGHLVPTEIVMEIIEMFIEKLAAGKRVLFDGIPRSADQKEQFDALMAKTGRSFKGILIALSEEEALRRLTTRRLCKNCGAIYPATYLQETCEKCGGELVTRKDDTPDAIQIRLQTFREKTLPVIQAYETSGLMLKVNGEQEVPKVTEDILALLPQFS